jgi:hypothetical protein
MSLTNALIAAPTDPDRLANTFLRVWDTFRLVERSPEFSSYEDLLAWSQPRSGYLGGKHPETVFAFWQDNAWAVLLDVSTCLQSEGDRLRRISTELGTVVTALTQGTSGTAAFELYENGVLRRAIWSTAGRVECAGDPVAAEAGINAEEHFYIKEIEQVWMALGMSSFWPGSQSSLFALHMVDLVDYGLPAPKRQAEKRKWWKLWGV